MKKILFIAFLIITIFSANASAQGTDGLIKMLMKSANVDKTQAMGGAGALFEMAKEKLSVEDFGKVAAVVPGMDKLLAAVPALAPKKSMLGAAAIKLSGNVKVLAAFKKLGISKTKVALFTPVIVNYIEKNGGKAVGDLIKNALK